MAMTFTKKAKKKATRKNSKTRFEHAINFKAARGTANKNTDKANQPKEADKKNPSIKAANTKHTSDPQHATKVFRNKVGHQAASLARVPKKKVPRIPESKLMVVNKSETKNNASGPKNKDKEKQK